MKIAIYLPGLFETKTDGYEHVDLSEIGGLDDGAYEEIFVDSCLDFIEQRDDFTKELVKKIRYKGQIIISGSDMYEISRAMVSKTIGLEEANSIIYDGRYSIGSVLDMVAKLQQLGLKVLHKRVNDFKYTIIAERPAPNANPV
tara:strand:- start:331 stop:759 length:429 start_codon:yes stop_codon:yes gene_type:complete